MGKNKTNQDLIVEMGTLLRRSGINLPGAQLDLLWLYHTILRNYNTQLNLTRIHNFKNMVLKLYVDSILPANLMDLPSPLLDLGTGPGMPGIPLKIAFPHLKIILSESRQNRVAFLEKVITELGLKGISVKGRAITPAFQEPVSGVITRAVERMEKTLQRISGCLEEKGLAIFMKGPNCDEEISEAENRFSMEYEVVRDQSYQIPHSPHRRRLVVFQRTSRSFGSIKAETMGKYPFHHIESEQNTIYKALKKLLTARGIKKQRAALVSGEKLVNEALRYFPEQCDGWITASDQQLPPENAPSHLSWYWLASSLFKTLDLFNTHSPLLRIRTKPVPEWGPREEFPAGPTVLIPFQDPENVGAVIRSAAAFGIRRVILLEESAHPFHPKAIRASGGAVFHVSFLQGPSIRKLRRDLPILALSPEGKDISLYRFPKTFAILPGVEGTGLPEDMRKTAFSIPIQKDVESLNAAAATAIVFYLWSQAKKKRGD